MISFPIGPLMDEGACYEFLFETLSPEGLCCPQGHALLPGQTPHKRNRAPLMKYKCHQCGKVFDLFTCTLLKGTHYSCSTLVLILRGFSQGIPTLHLARELEIDYSTLLYRRHAMMGLAFFNQERGPLPDDAVESDEMFQNAGEKGTLHDDPDDPPRVRANKRRGKGTMANDRPPVLGSHGRESGQIRMEVIEDTKQATIQPEVEKKTRETSVNYTDESSAYFRLSRDTPRKHHTVSHGKKEWARDDDGDGIREVHSNTIEGFWTGLRNYLRPFRGVHKRNLKLYVAMHQWAHNLKLINCSFLRSLLIANFTYFPT